VKKPAKFNNALHTKLGKPCNADDAWNVNFPQIWGRRAPMGVDIGSVVTFYRSCIQSLKLDICYDFAEVLNLRSF